MALVSDGVQAAAVREQEFHPLTKDGKPITAWRRRADTIDRLVGKVNDLEGRLAALEAQQTRPFP